MFSAVFLLAFAAFLRVGEITVKYNRDVHYGLSSKDIIIDQSASTIYVTSSLVVKNRSGLDLLSAMTVYLIALELSFFICLFLFCQPI